MPAAHNPLLGRERVAAVFTVLVGVSGACGDVGDQLAKLTASDGAAGHEFGASVSMHEDVALIGAPGIIGAAYLYDLTTATLPIEMHRLSPKETQPGSDFGFSTSLHESLAVVGARRRSVDGAGSGAVYTFDATTGEEMHRLVATDGADRDEFGFSVATNGDLIVVGAIFDDDNGTNSGSAYVFDASSGAQLLKLLPRDGRSNDLFGYSVAVSDEFLFVSALGDDNLAGAVYVFDAANGAEVAKITASDRTGSDQFGAAVDVEGSIMLVGAIRDDDIATDAGSAYVFDVSDPRDSVEIAKVFADDGAAGDRFGRSISIDGSTAMVGAIRHDGAGDDAGAGYLFDIPSGLQVAKLEGDDGAPGDRAGLSVALTDRVALLGARLHDGVGLDGGAAYVFLANNCRADVNSDGSVNAEDFLEFLDLFASDDPRADIDGDKNIDADDFFGYLDLFVAGC